jgi:FKBP-type peptidyl-prolyl cis-trans isomerase FklB
MQVRWITALVLASFVADGILLAQQPPKGAPAEGVAPNGATNGNFKTFKEQSSYAIGIDIGRGMKSQGLEVDSAMLAKGLADGLGGGKSLLSDKELQATLIQLKRDAAANLADKNKKEGAAFLAENKKKEGVKTTASGLQYKALRDGKGATPRATDIVTTHYRGTFLDGTEFDSSYRRNEPTKFPCNRVIKGWTEALQMMKVGDKWQLFIPSELAYGEQGMGEDIPPNATLVFELELLDTKAAPAGGATLPPPKE